jgi:acetyltransferase
VDIIETFLHPKSVAVIGASKSPMKGGNRIVNNLVLNNFNGKVYPINPTSEGKVFGLEFKKSVLDIQDDVDIAIFYVPNKVIPPLLEECIQKGIKGAIIEASGFEEVGDPGIELKNQIRKITKDFSKLRIVGPNCMGLTRIDASSDNDEKGGFFSSFGVFQHYIRGNIAIISQSGMMNGGYLTHLMSNYGLGFRYSCSVGNKMDLSENEFLEYLLKEPTVNVIAIYLESFKDPRKFISLNRKAKSIPNKTIIFVKGGLTSLGQKAALSHTAALSENTRLIEAVIKQSGIIQANSFYELFQFARTFSMMYTTRKKLPEKGNASMIAGSGGAGTLTSDLTMKYGLNFPELGNAAYNALKDVFPEWMPPNRFALVDIWPAMEKAMMQKDLSATKLNLEKVMNIVYDAILNEPNIEGLFNMIFCAKSFAAMSNIDKVVEYVNKSSKPVFFWLIGEADEVKRISLILTKNNIPDFHSLEEMVKNFWILVQETKNRNKKY